MAREVDVTTRIVINRPRPVVAGYAADPARAPEWYENIESVVWRSRPLVEPGSRITFVAHFLWRRLEYTYEIVSHVPQESLVMRTADGPFPMETSYHWRGASPDTTEMTLRNRGTPSGFSALLTPFLSPAMRRANRKDLQRLKAILERA